MLRYCEADLFGFLLLLFCFVSFFLAFLGGAEYCDMESKKDFEDFQGSGKNSVALGCFTLYLHFIKVLAYFG